MTYLIAELKLRIDNYFKGDEEALPSILEAILRRKLTGKHEETDEELLDDLQLQPLDDVKDTEFESDFEELCETDEDIDNLYNAKEYAVDKIVKDKYFNMDDKKWDEIIKEATEKGFLKDTGECERILEDMLNWDKLLPGIFHFSPFCRFYRGYLRVLPKFRICNYSIYA